MISTDVSYAGFSTVLGWASEPLGLDKYALARGPNTLKGEAYLNRVYEKLYDFKKLKLTCLPF